MNGHNMSLSDARVTRPARKAEGHNVTSKDMSLPDARVKIQGRLCRGGVAGPLIAEEGGERNYRMAPESFSR